MSIGSAERDVDQSPAPPIRAQLRQATAALHEEIEQKLDLPGADGSLDRYRNLLQAFYGFHAPVEESIRSAGLAAPGFSLPARAALLERDLLALGASASAIEELPRCRKLPAVESAGKLAGCLYVIEGACLGGQIIARGLAQRLGIGPDTGAAFFVGEGAGTAARWKQVIAWIEEVVRGGAPAAEVVESARATFGALLRWSQEQGVARG